MNTIDICQTLYRLAVGAVGFMFFMVNRIDHGTLTELQVVVGLLLFMLAVVPWDMKLKSDELETGVPSTRPDTVSNYAGCGNWEPPVKAKDRFVLWGVRYKAVPALRPGYCAGCALYDSWEKCSSRGRPSCNGEIRGDGQDMIMVKDEEYWG